MKSYEVIGLLYTRTCPLACEHCIIESSPKQTDKMQFSAAMEMLPTIARHVDTLCFTGGEPLLYYTEVLGLIEAAKRLGLTTSLVSGAGWVRNREVVERRIARLKEAGLDKICVSADRYHEAYSPPERAHLLTEVAHAAGITVLVRGVLAADQNACEEKSRFAPGNLTYDPVPLVRLGAARDLPESHFRYSELPPRGRCKVALSTVVEPDGNVYACCGPSRFSVKSSPLVLGNLSEEPLDEILTRGVQDPLLNALKLIGPFGLLELLKRHPRAGELIKLRAGYTGMCELCLDLTDSIATVAALRARLSETDAQALLVAASLSVAQERTSSCAAEEKNHPLTPTNQVSDATKHFTQLPAC